MFCESTLGSCADRRGAPVGGPARLISFATISAIRAWPNTATADRRRGADIVRCTQRRGGQGNNCGDALDLVGIQQTYRLNKAGPRT